MDKQHILDEIRRVAKGNGGIPPGKNKLFSEAGIKESDWLGKYWPRYSDAMHEAGFTPNKKAQAYSDEFLITSLISLIRELGRFPARGDLRIRVRNDSGFPGDKALRRLGSKDDIVRLVTEYARTHPSFADVLVLLPAVSSTVFGPKSEAGDEELGFVYLLKSGRFYKIGRSNSSGRREYELAIQLPEKAKKIHEIRTDDAVGIEAYWHRRFESRRKNGEWFELTPQDIRAFRRRKFM
jgi:hypothetical protein